MHTAGLLTFTRASQITEDDTARNAAAAIMRGKSIFLHNKNCKKTKIIDTKNRKKI